VALPCRSFGAQRRRQNFMKTILIPAVAIAMLSLMSPGRAQSESDSSEFNLGMERYRAGDMDAAITAWTKHLKANPKDSVAYHKRGNARQNKGDLDGALADYSRAIDLDPENTTAYNTRGIVKRAKGDLDGALADYGRAIEVDPNSAGAYNNRGNVRRDKGEVDAAVTDYTRALEIDPNHASACQNRGDTYFLLRRWPEALADLRTRCEVKETGQEYARFMIWLIRTRLGETKEADEELTNYVMERWQGAPRDWASRIGAFLTGQLSEAELMTASAAPEPTVERGQRCEAYFFAGMKRLLAGERDAAIANFRQCLATEQKHFVEYQFAQAELKELGN
jgi:lipoprotein NlpI